jgi:hypothetical protein
MDRRGRRVIWFLVWRVLYGGGSSQPRAARTTFLRVRCTRTGTCHARQRALYRAPADVCRIVWATHGGCSIACVGGGGRAACCRVPNGHLNMSAANSYYAFTITHLLAIFSLSPALQITFLLLAGDACWRAFCCVSEICCCL